MLNLMRLRVAQFVRYARPGTVEIAAVHAYLNPQSAATFAKLQAGDQRHALAVAHQLESKGASSCVVTAGLLHDIGKAVPGVPVHIAHRIAKVMLATIAPNLLALLATRDQPRWPFGGLWVLSRHARCGGEMVRRWGYPERVAWLIEHHEDDEVTDPELALLVAADDGHDARAMTAGVTHG